MNDDGLYDESRREYDAMASDYALDSGHERLDEEVLRLFLRSLPGRGRILDLGCGPGQYSRRLVAEGYEVEAIDNSPAMIKELSRRGRPEGLTARCLDMRSLDYSDRSFVGIFALASLIHLTEDDLPPVLSKMCRMLTTNGVLLANFAISDKGLRRERQSATEYATSGRFFQHYSNQDIPRHALEAAGFRINEIYTRVVRPTLSDGTKGRSEWVNFLVSLA